MALEIWLEVSRKLGDDCNSMSEKEESVKKS